ncbi:hypothetical protein DSM43276_00757 [Mycobacteroides salmoniphilum]|nr:hypothetical protein DSM43276_00757 [Mycobacteroides salmoniphilum]
MFAVKLFVLRRITVTVTLANLNTVLRLRLAIGVYALAAFILSPLPPSWGWFWCALTVLGAVLGCAAIARMMRTERLR